MSNPAYETLGLGYVQTRQAEPALMAQIEAALGNAVSVVNVGAGTGSYESAHRRVVAVEPAEAMIRQRSPLAAPCVRSGAESLPFADRSVDACTAFFTVHHWQDKLAGLREMRRIARGTVVIVTFLPGAIADEKRWLAHDYFPEIAAFDDRVFLPLQAYQEALGLCEVQPFLIPRNCTDGFLDAFWARPEAYLQPEVRSAMSAFRLIDPGAVERGLALLREDLQSGQWDKKHGELRRQATYDAGLRLLMSR
jgi:SAM-dependent methyltransferase